MKRRTWFQYVESLKGNFEGLHVLWTQWKKGKIIGKLQKNQIYGKVEGNVYLTNKNKLFKGMCEYYTERGINPFSVLPLTYVIKGGDRVLNDP